MDKQFLAFTKNMLFWSHLQIENEIETISDMPRRAWLRSRCKYLGELMRKSFVTLEESIDDIDEFNRNFGDMEDDINGIFVSFEARFEKSEPMNSEDQSRWGTIKWIQESMWYVCFYACTSTPE